MKYAGEALVLIVYAAIIYNLVRPNSQGPRLVTSITNGLANLIKAGEGR